MTTVAALTKVRSTALLAAIALAAGLGYGWIDETEGLGNVAFFVFVFACMSLGATGVALSNRHSGGLRPAFKALPVMVVAVCGIVLGHFAPYLFGTDGRTLEDYSLTMSWETNLLATLFMAVLFGSLLGLLASLLSHGLRRSLPGAAV